MMKQKTNKRYERLSSASKKQLVLESDSVLDELKQDAAAAPPGMDYFYDVASNFARGEIAKQDGKKYIATSCVQVPIELIYAAGAVPVRTCSGAHSIPTPRFFWPVDSRRWLCGSGPRTRAPWPWPRRWPSTRRWAS